MQLADCLQQQTLEAGQKILKQGEPGDTFYIVEDFSGDRIGSDRIGSLGVGGGSLDVDLGWVLL